MSIKQKPVIIALPVLLCGGTEIQTLNLIRFLVGKEYRVTVCCYFDEYDQEMVTSMEEEGAQVILMGLHRDQGLLHLIIRLQQFFRETLPNIVHVQYIAPGLSPILSARLAGVTRVFSTVHQPSRPYGLKAKLLLRLAAYLCTAFFCVSKSTEESWFGNSEVFNPKNVSRKRKHFTIYNAVDVSAITQEVKSIDQDQLEKSLFLDGCPVVGIVGRLRKEKGHAILLDAMVEVIEDFPVVKLLVVGDGPDRNQLVLKAESLGIANRILWLGTKEPGEVFQLYNIMDVVAVPSLFEGFGLSAAEAMAAGLPVVASAVDGLNEVVEHGKTGYLVPPGDSIAIAKYIVELLLDPSKANAMGKEGFKRVKEHFSQERFAKAILAAYQHFS